MSGTSLLCRFLGTVSATIQVKVYRRKYLRKGNYVCRSYYLYLPKEIAEPLVGKKLRIVRKWRGILIEPIDLDTNIAREHLPSRAENFHRSLNILGAFR